MSTPTAHHLHMFRSLIGCCVLLLLSCSSPSEQTGSHRTDKVIQGQRAPQEESVVALTYDGLIKCTGTLIAPRTVVTAAHCIYTRSRGVPVPPENVVVIINSIWTESADVIDYAFHPKWTGEAHQAALLSGNDLALLYLDRALEASPIALDNIPASERIDSSGMIIGFGKTDPYDAQSAGIRHRASMKVLRTLGPNQQLLELVSSDEWYRGACHGDSGGPFMIDTPEKRVLSGVTSFGTSYCDGSSKYVSIASHLQWIEENISERTTGLRELDLSSAEEDLDSESSSPTYTCYELLACFGRCGQNDLCQQECTRQTTTETVEQAKAVIECNQDFECQGASTCLIESCNEEVYACSPELLNTPLYLDDAQAASDLSCEQLMSCLDLCTSHFCQDDCTAQASQQAIESHRRLLACIDLMGCEDDACAEWLCELELAACIDR